MKDLSVGAMVRSAVLAIGGDGLYNDDYDCGCDLDDMAPGNCLYENCVPAKAKKFEDCTPAVQRHLRDTWGMGPGEDAYFPVKEK